MQGLSIANEHPSRSISSALRGSAIWRSKFIGPLIALVLAGLAFSLGTSTFFTASNISLILDSSVVIGMLALGQTLVVLTAGIDLANGIAAVLGAVVMAKLVVSGDPVLALVVGMAFAIAVPAASGAVITIGRLPPFLVTLGTLTAVTAAASLYTHSLSIPVTSNLLTWLGGSVSIGSFNVSYGTLVWIGASIVLAYALNQTTWGVHVMTVGNSPEAARRVGIKTQRVLMSVYVVAGVCYALAAWESLGLAAVADPSGYSTANLSSITAVAIGGTSLFGGRGGVFGTFLGVLIVTVLTNGLTQANIDSLYQNVATGILVIGAVAIDEISRRRRRA